MKSIILKCSRWNISIIFILVYLKNLSKEPLSIGHFLLWFSYSSISCPTYTRLWRSIFSYWYEMLKLDLLVCRYIFLVFSQLFLFHSLKVYSHDHQISFWSFTIQVMLTYFYICTHAFVCTYLDIMCVMIQDMKIRRICKYFAFYPQSFFKFKGNSRNYFHQVSIILT